MCERELETEQNCNILTPTLLAITAFLSRSPGLLNRGPGGPAYLGHVPQSSILSLTRLIPSCNSSIEDLRAHSAGCWLSLPHLLFLIQLSGRTSAGRAGCGTDLGGARGVVVIVVGIGHGDTSSNPGRD